MAVHLKRKEDMQRRGVMFIGLFVFIKNGFVQ